MDQATYQALVLQCRDEAIAAGALEPQGVWERMASGPIAYEGGDWSRTARAQHRLAEWTQERVQERLRQLGYV